MADPFSILIVAAVVLLIYFAGRSSDGRGGRFRASAEPQRLLALAGLRRQILHDALGLSGAEADLAAFAPAARLRARLAEADLDPVIRHLCALGLVATGHLDAMAMLLDTCPVPPPAVTIQAIKLLLPVPVRLLRAPTAEPLFEWVRRNSGRFAWRAEAERYTL